MQLLDSVKECVDEFDADILVINSPMLPGLDDKLRTVLAERLVKRGKVIVILVTEGGIADVAYRAARMLQGNYETLDICISGWCKSAGTLMAIAANSLIIGDDGEMGPLDVQLAVRDEIGNRNSGLILESAIDSLQEASFGLFEKFMMQIKAKSANNVTFRTAAELASQMTIGLMAPIFQQIDPIRMGDDARAQKIGEDYAVRLNMGPKNLKPDGALEMLLRGYPSHSFVIDSTEARWLFSNVKPLDGTLAHVVEALGRVARVPLGESDGLVTYMSQEQDKEEAANDEGSGIDDAAGSEGDPAPALHAAGRGGKATTN